MGQLNSAESGYFDVVLGNPPYINIERLDLNFRNYLLEKYYTCKGRTDIYIAFLEKTLELLSLNGINTFIIPYAYTNQNYGELSRRNFVTNYAVSEIVDTSNYYVFDSAVVKNIILRIKKTTTESNTKIKIANSSQSFTENSFIERDINTDKFLKLKNCRLETKDFENALSIKDKIDTESLKLEDICLVAYGVRVNHKTDKTKPKSHYISNTHINGYKKFIEGRSIDRYNHKQYGWLNYTPSEHYNPMFTELFENDKIIFINVVSERLRFSLDTNNLYNSHTVINCVRIDKLVGANHISARRALNNNNNNIEKAKKISMQFLLGLLNSNLINWYFKQFQSEGLHFYPDDAKQLPIKLCNSQTQQPIITLVNIILEVKQENPQADTSEWENEIDQLVYQLYGLTDEEIAVVEG